MRNLNKKKFFFFYPHTITIGLEAPVYRGFCGEGKGEGMRAGMAEGNFFLGRTSENIRTESYGRRFVCFYCYIFAPCEADAAERDEAAALFIYNN